MMYTLRSLLIVIIVSVIVTGFAGYGGQLTCTTAGYDPGVYSTTECFDYSSGGWVYQPSLDLPDGGEIYATTITFGNSIACLAGGSFNPQRVACTNGSGWVALQSLSVERTTAAAVYSSNGYVGVVSGYTITISSSEPESTWEYTNNKAPLAHGANLNWQGGSGAPARSEAAVLAFNGTPCLVGGDEVVTSSCLSINNAWVPGPSISTLRGGAIPLHLPGRECVIGGIPTAPQYPYLNSVECAPSSSSSSYSYSVDSTLKYPLVIARASNVTLYGMQCVVGGETRPNSAGETYTAATYCINTSALPLHWIQLASLNDARAGMTAYTLSPEPTPAPTRSPTLSPTRTPTTPPPTITPTSSPITSNPTSLTPTTTPTTSPTTTPTTSPTTTPTTSPTTTPTTSPIPFPTTLTPTTLFPTTHSPTKATSNGTAYDVEFVFVLVGGNTTNNNNTNTNASAVAYRYITALLAKLNLPLTLSSSSSSSSSSSGVETVVVIKSAYFSDDGNLHVVVQVVGTDAKDNLEQADGVTVLNATVHVQWPSVIQLLLNLPVWVPIVLGLLALALVVGLLLLSKKRNPRAQLSPLFGFLAHFCSLWFQCWSAYTLYVLQKQSHDLYPYFVVFILALFIPMVPNLGVVVAVGRMMWRSSAGRVWIKQTTGKWWGKILPALVLCCAITSNSRMLSMLYSGSFGLKGFSAPIEPVIHRLVQASGLVGMLFGDLPRCVIQVIVVILAPDPSAFAAVALPLIFSIIVLFTISLQTIYRVAYAERDIIQLTAYKHNKSQSHSITAGIPSPKSQSFLNITQPIR